MNSSKNTHKFDIIGIDMSCIKNKTENNNNDVKKNISTNSTDSLESIDLNLEKSSNKNNKKILNISYKNLIKLFTKKNFINFGLFTSVWFLIWYFLQKTLWFISHQL